MQVIKTVKIPIHYATTKRKLHILNRLTAQTTYGVYLWSQIIGKNNLKATYVDRAMFCQEVKEKTGLPSAFVQCCFDTAKWMWRSYRKLHAEWKHQLKKTKGKWYEKLLKREPQKPFANGLEYKVPIWFDQRIGSIEKASIKLTPYVARISTISKGEKLVIPLNPAEYHLNLLLKGKLKSFQIVKRTGKFYVHVKIEYEVSNQPIHAVRGIDLGIKRSVATVLLRPNQSLRSRDFTIIRDGLKKDRLHRLNQRIARLQQAERWEPLKRIRHKRRHLAEYFDRLSAKAVADISNNCLVVIGYPKGVKYRNYKGNNKAFLRKLLTHWSYGRIIRYIQEECAERGIIAKVVGEYWSSKTCWKCGSQNTERINQSILWCWNCCKYFNADFNGAINIGLPFLAKAVSQQAADEPAQTEDEQAREIVACKLGSQHASAVGSSQKA